MSLLISIGVPLLIALLMMTSSGSKSISDVDLKKYQQRKLRTHFFNFRKK